jgi:hypothetical protein
MSGLREKLAERRAKLESGQDPGEFNAAAEVEEDTPEVVEDEAPEVEEQPEETAETPEETVVEEEKPVEEAVAAANPETPGEKAPEQFVADYKYRADGKDLEVPDYLRPLIKDKASQDQVVNLLKKHDAFDTVSQRRDQFRTERDQERAEKQKYVTAIDTMRNTYQRGDIDGFLKMCEISEDKMLQWATEKAKYLMGDENYRRTVDQQNQLRQNAWKNESQATDYQSKFQEMEARQLHTEFNYEMMKPEVSSFVASFDKQFGNGAFVNEVKNRGELAYLREQKTIAPSEVIQGIMKQFSAIAQVPQPAPAAAPSGAPAAKVIVKPAAKVPTIPTVKGSQASPTKEGFTSLDQIRKYRKDTYGK